MSGTKGIHKAAILVPGYGTYYLHVTEVTYGINIISTETESRHGKAIYISAKTAGSFGLGLVFFKHADWHDFSRIMLHYANNLSRGLVGSPCRVMIPSIKDKGKSFDRVGIPRNGVPFGDNVATVAYRTRLDFFGTTDPYGPVGIKDVGKVSNVIGAEYAQAIKRDPQAAYYYPVGSQLSGSNYGVDTLYDSVPSDEGGFEEAPEASGASSTPNFTPGGRPGAREF